MKSSIERMNKSNKRSQALKGILEKQNGVDAANGSSPIPCIPSIPSIQDIKEDLIEGMEIPSRSNTPTMVTFGAGSIGPVSTQTKTQASSQTNSTQSISQSIAQSIELFNKLIAKELARAAKNLGIAEAELQAWVNLQIEVPAKTILTLLRMMQSLHLDPLSEEIGFTQYEDGQWQVLITIEGCSKLLNQHPQFNGLRFTQADTLIDGLPEWMECSIYRKDREVPTTVREYLTEVKGENEIWRKMPRRMLRHRALQQCVRLAMAY